MGTPTFTVFTPTLNRAHTLGRVYESLCRQTYSDFEWIVVDDGSTDSTSDLVRHWIAESRLPIRYITQPHGGKHVADNRAVREARGTFITNLDSDDWFLPNALEEFVAIWNSVDPTARAEFVGGVALAASPDGEVIGTPFPADVLDTTYAEMARLISGDKTGFARVDVVRRYPYPVIPGETFTIEAIQLFRVARDYRVRCVNKVLMIAEYQPGGLSAEGALGFVRSPRTARLFFAEMLELQHLSWQERFRGYANHGRYALHGRELWKTRAAVPSKLAWIATLPVASILCLRDRVRFRGRLEPRRN